MGKAGSEITRRRRKPSTQFLKPPHVLDPDIIRTDQEQRRQLANERRKQEAQPTPEERDAIAAYFADHPSGYGAASYLMEKFGWSKSTAGRRINLWKKLGQA
jgi:hypothetical protein